MTRFLSRSVLCTATLLCACAMVRADEAKDKLPLSAQPTISLQATSSKSDVAAFLKTPVSFKLKDASFLSALDAVLTASGKTCPIECRQMKPMKLNFGVKDQTADSVLDTLAKAGGGSLYILPDKLLLSPPALLSAEEKKIGKPYSMLLSKATLPQGKTLSKQLGGVDMVAIANTKISRSMADKNWGSAASELLRALPYGTMKPLEPLNLEGYAPAELVISGTGVKDVSLSFQDVPLGEALGVLAHMNGCELYLLPNKFLMCAPNELTPEQQKVAVPAFQYPGFGSPAPSGSKS